MKVSYKGDYALKVILDLSEQYMCELVHIEDISQRQDIPKKFLEQILLALKKGGFVQSKKGPNGGYFLTRHPKEIYLGEVLRYVEGPLLPISCLDPNAAAGCDFVPKCVFYEIWQKVSLAIEEIIDDINFEQIMKRAADLSQIEVINYHI